MQTEINTKEMGGRPKPTPSSWHLPQPRSFAVISSSAIGRRVTRIEQSSCELRGLALAGDSAEAEPMSASIKFRQPVTSKKACGAELTCMESLLTAP